MEKPYDPLDYDNLAKSVVSTLLEKKPEPLPPAEAFAGAGVYAMYYSGKWPAYSAISSPRKEIPIYVGKAIPAGGRKGETIIGSSSGKELFNRLVEHSKSIEQVKNLNRADFSCRYLVVLPVWIGLAEQFLINHFKPAWNLALDGFGNHPPGKGRVAMKRPRWDIVHPGRPWATILKAEEGPEELIEMVKEFLRQNVS